MTPIFPKTVRQGDDATPEERLAALAFNFDTILEPRPNLMNDILWHFHEIVRQERSRTVSAVAAERERCAQIAESHAKPGDGGIDIASGIPSEIYVAIGRGRYDEDDDGDCLNDLAYDTAASVRSGIAARIRAGG